MGTTHTDLAVRSSTRSATGRMLPLLGRMITSSDRTASTASTSSAVDGFMDWPPAMSPCTPRDRKIRPTPSPVATATTPVVGAGPGGVAAGPLPDGARALTHPALLLHLLEQVGHPDGARPAGVEGRLDGRTDVIGVDVAVPQAVPADHHDGVPEAGPDLLERGDGLVGRLEQVHHLVAETGQGSASASASAPA